MDSHLPPHSADWPQDPFQLLGVARGADLREIRRAYAKLTRLFKPEHSPKEFQLIRAAYERISAWAEYRVVFQEPPEPETEELSEPATAPVAEPPITHPEPKSPPARRESLAAGLIRLRELLINGEYAAGHAHLLELARSFPDAEEVQLRLLWLRTLVPSLVPDHDPLTLLTSAPNFKPSPLQWQVILRFLEWEPSRLLTPLVEQWLRRPIPLHVLSRLILLRWRVAIREGWTPLIGEDLKQLRPRLMREGTGPWLSTVLIAQRLVRWFRGPAVGELWTLLCHEFRVFEGESLALARLYDEHEWLDTVRQTALTDPLGKQSAAARGKPSDEWVEILQLAAIGPEDRLRLKLEEALAPWVDSSSAALRGADQLFFRDTEFAQAIHSFLDDLTLPGPDNRHLVARVEWAFEEMEFRQTDTPSHTRRRLRILDFCVEESITLAQLLDMIDNGQATLTSGLSLPEMFRNDFGLALAIQGTRVFWDLPEIEYEM